VIYQLFLDIINNDECECWRHSDNEEKIDTIKQNIAKAHCGIKNDTESAFSCRTEQDGHVIYNAHLSQEVNTTVIELVACMNLWVTNTDDIKIKGDWYVLTKNCSGVLVDSDSDPFICPWLPPTPTPTSKPLGVGEGVGIGIGIGIGIMVPILILGVLVTRRITKRYNNYHNVIAIITITIVNTIQAWRTYL
jgi:hypothetical protein